jgi:hypothetical protein
LAEKSGIKILGPIPPKLREFMEFHFEARYPDGQQVFYCKCTKAYSTARLEEIKRVRGLNLLKGEN